MKYRLFGRGDLRVSEVCLGTMSFGAEWGWRIPKEQAHDIFFRFSAAGGNFIDTANINTGGTNETLIGEFIQGQRSHYIISTQCPSASNIKDSLDASLQRLNSDYIDLYWINGGEFNTSIEETMYALDAIVREGKVLYIGIAAAPAWVAARANTLAELHSWTPFVGIQVDYNLTVRAAEHEVIPMAEALGLTVAASAPLAGGLLAATSTKEAQRLYAYLQPKERELAIVSEVTKIAQQMGKKPAQIALNWFKYQGDILPIVGVSHIHHLEEVLAAFSFKLPTEALDRLQAVSSIAGFPQPQIEKKRLQQLLWANFLEGFEEAQKLA